MPRAFGIYSPVVSLGVTWTDSFEITTEKDLPLDLTGYGVHAQLREQVPGRDADGNANLPPIFEVTTAGFHDPAPTWPVVEGFSIEDPESGVVALNVSAEDTWLASPGNTKRKLLWDVRLVNTDTGSVLPLVSGKVSFIPAKTIK